MGPAFSISNGSREDRSKGGFDFSFSRERRFLSSCNDDAFRGYLFGKC